MIDSDELIVVLVEVDVCCSLRKTAPELGNSISTDDKEDDNALCEDKYSEKRQESVHRRLDKGVQSWFCAVEDN